MNEDLDYELLVSLTEERGVPGYEDRVRERVREAMAPHVDRLRSDAMGNLIGTVEGDADYDVVVAAHVDEIGFMVRHVDDEGFLELDPLGGWDPRILRAQRVTVHAADGDVPGLIGSVPPHTLDEADRETTPDVEDVRVDLGLDAEAVDERVSVGDLVTMDQSTKRVGEFVTGKALDNRVSVFAMLEAARRLGSPSVNVHFAATTQEEVGLRGAEALGVDLDPDLVVAVDTTVANDVPGFEPGERVTELGEGVGIKLKDASVITSHKVHRRLREVAESDGIDHQMEVLPAGGTDTGGLQRPSGATPAGAVSVPTRYLHTPTESVHGDDVAATVDLLVGFLESEDGAHDYTL
ncbi:peptidase M42 [Halobacteriales archaeon QS_1_68_44]|nr:MAG: peptidase M42 [Halobacteriales archaeon QS_1_68_44]